MSAEQMLDVTHMFPKCCILPSDREHIFLFGGRGPGGDVATASLYDPGARTWTAVGGVKKPPKRSCHVSVVFEKVFVHGGEL